MCISRCISRLLQWQNSSPRVGGCDDRTYMYLDRFGPAMKTLAARSFPVGTRARYLGGIPGTLRRSLVERNTCFLFSSGPAQTDPRFWVAYASWAAHAEGRTVPRHRPLSPAAARTKGRGDKRRRERPDEAIRSRSTIGERSCRSHPNARSSREPHATDASRPRSTTRARRAAGPARPPLSDRGLQLELAEPPFRYGLPFLPSDSPSRPSEPPAPHRLLLRVPRPTWPVGVRTTIDHHCDQHDPAQPGEEAGTTEASH